ncbi:MAG: YkgJ family cysteine cluster protein [Armatimonadota bacterium]
MPDHIPDATKKVQEEIAALYAMIPAFECLKGCTVCCGPVPCHPAEEEAMPKREINLNNTWLTCEHAMFRQGCSCYEHRPLLCRLFGTVPSLPCPFGRGPEKLLTKEQEDEIKRRYRALMEVNRD